MSEQTNHPKYELPDDPHAACRYKSAMKHVEYAKAAGFYEKSLTLADADRDTSLTRLGIAQLGAGNTAAAIDTFGKVSGPRAPIAKLWMAYAQQQAKAATGGATAS